MKTTKKIVLFSIVSIATFAFIMFIYSFIVIYKGVKAICIASQNEYKKECVSALVEYIQSEKHTFRERNSAVWALGQLADKRALPVLRSLYTGNIPTKESLDKTISQYELKKAITWCEKGNVTSWMYRNRERWH